jgi:5'-3' exonuclease
MDRLLLLDGNGLIYRGYFALIDQPLTTSKGELVTAVFGFTNIVLRAIQDAKPDLIAVAFDLPAPTFRHDRYAEYKATRTRMPDDMRDQIPKVREVVRVLGIPVYQKEGFEADDVIATLVGQAESEGFETVILTGDLDMLQLVSENTRLMVSLRGGVANTVSYDLAKVNERWGLVPGQMLDYKALKGDPTDNIPGIPGVGEKTASKLIATWGTLDELYAHIDEVTPEKLRAPLEEHRASVLESRELMRLVRDVDVQLDTAVGRVGTYDREGVVRLFREYEFRTLIDRLPPLVGERPEDAVAAMRELRDAGFPAAQGLRSGGGGGAPGTSGFAAGAAAAGAAGSTRAGGQLQLSLDFDLVSGRRAASSSVAPPAADGSAAEAPRAEDDASPANASSGDASTLQPGSNGTTPERRAEAIAIAAGDLPGALAAAIEDPGRIEVVDERGVAGARTVAPAPGRRRHRARGRRSEAARGRHAVARGCGGGRARGCGRRSRSVARAPTVARGPAHAPGRA